MWALLSWVVLENLVPLVSSVPSTSPTPLPPLPWGYLSIEGRNLMETSHLRLSAPRSFTLYNDQLRLHFSQPLLEKVSLMRAGQDTDLWVKQNVISSHFISMLLQQYSRIWFSPRSTGITGIHCFMKKWERKWKRKRKELHFLPLWRLNSLNAVSPDNYISDVYLRKSQRKGGACFLV